MLTPTATTSAMFAAIGLAPADLWGVVTSLISSTISIGLWLVQSTWYWVIGAAVLYGVLRMVYKYLGFGHTR